MLKKKNCIFSRGLPTPGLAPAPRKQAYRCRNIEFWRIQFQCVAECPRTAYQLYTSVKSHVHS